MRPEILAHWDRLSPLLDEALDLEPGRRGAWLDALAPANADLRPLLASLLAAQGGDATAAALPDLPDYPPAEEPAGESHAPGDLVAGWLLVRVIGRGGMGTVWLAEPAEGGARMPAALKLPRVELPAAHIRERFERERAFLAALNHPRIARLLEAGVSAEGQPYLAIEYVEGGSIVEHCDAKAPGLRERVALFLQVLEAVQYAHANLVIHRDLKPSNILVTATGDVKLLDFGIAKLLDRGTASAAETGLTRRAGHVMTPEYASPEQVAGLPLTTASDVYSLGVILFELLAGARPYRLRRGTRAELEEAVLAADTARPSTVATAAIAARAREPATRWRRRLRGDLDTIVLKALAKDPAARYPGADAFRADLARWLAGEPILARPPSEWYRLRRFAARHRIVAGAAAAVLVSLVAGLSAALWQASVAREEAAKARAIQGFLTELLAKNTRHQAQAARSRATTVREALVEAADRVPSAFRDSPALRAELSLTVARLLMDVDEFPKAAALFRDAASLAREAGGAEHEVDALIGLAGASRLLGNADEGIAARDRALAILDARGDGETLARARASASSVAQLSRDPARELALAERAVAIFARHFPAHPDRFGAILVTAHLQRINGGWKAARERFLEAVRVFDASGGRDFSGRAAAMAWAGFCASRQGLVEEGLAELAAGIADLSTHAGRDALITRFHRGHYADLLHVAGGREDSRREFAALRATAPAAPTVVDFDNAIYEADGLVRDGLPREAEALLARFAPVHVEMGKRFYPNGVRWATLLALARARQGRHADAQAALARIRDLPAQFPVPAEQLLDYRIDVARVLRAAGRGDEAQRVLFAGSAGIGEPPPHFSLDYVDLALTALDLALDGGDVEAARGHLALADEHFRRHGRPGSHPGAESAVSAGRKRLEGAAGR